jgi:diguanylate cyclase (GGDEF)-like protein
MSMRGKLLIALTVIALAAFSTWLVYATGGVRFAYLHLMYVPIVISGLTFGLPGGIAAGVLCGILVGPLMPLNTDLGLLQETHNWIYRLCFFTIIGSLIGTWSQLLMRHLQELEWLHEHHEDTGLLNFTGLKKHLNGMTQNAPQERKFVASITQLDNLLEIQNTFGSEFGLRVLAQVVERAKKVLPSESLLAIVQPDRLATIISADDAHQVTRQRIEDALKQSFLVDGVPVHVEASVGLSYFPIHARSPDELIQKASIAMHRASTTKSSVSVYDSAYDRTSRDNLVLLGTLPDAIEQGQLQIWHQAKLNLASGKISGSEALVRWQHPERGMVPPGLFIPQAEETTLINPLTHAVIASAFSHAGSWKASGHQIRVAVNLSVRNLMDRMLFDTLEQSTRRNELDPSDIELEITESAVMADPSNCIKLIAVLRERGYGVAIDDFGTGQSSLAYLQELRVSTLKIDQAFIRKLVSDEKSQKIVRAILFLAKSLGLETVAEGVEDQGAIEILQEWGCDYAQGYAIHRPSTAKDFLHFLIESRT